MLASTDDVGFAVEIAIAALLLEDYEWRLAQVFEDM